jgi:hypothetical protein
VPFNGSEVKTPYRITNVEECTPGLKIANPYFGRLPSVFDVRQLSYEIRRCIVQLPWTSGIEKAKRNAWNLVIFEILSREQIEADLTDPVRVQGAERLLFGYRDCRTGHMAVLSTGACGNNDRRPPHSPYALEQMKGAHNIGFKRLDRLCP